MTSAQIAAYAITLCSLAPAFSQNNDNAGPPDGPLTVETFQTFAVPNSLSAQLDCPVLNSTAICNGQGPGLVVPGVNFTFGQYGGQWDGANYFGSHSRELVSNGSQPLTIDFTTPVTIFGVDVRAYSGGPYAATATLTVYGLDDQTVIGTLSGVYLSQLGIPIRVGWQDDAGIGKVVLTQSGQTWSPVIDNLEFAAPTATLTFSGCGSHPGHLTSSCANSHP